MSRFLLSNSGNARQARLTLIQKEADLSRVLIQQNISDETCRAVELQRLNQETDAKRRQAVQQFPGFFEQQMQAIVASNAFSMGSKVSTWTGFIAQMVVHGGNLKAVWKQTHVALVQAALNTGVQMVAQAAPVAPSTGGAVDGFPSGPKCSADGDGECENSPRRS